MALTQVSTDGVKNDAISHNKIPANAIQASELADNAVDTAAIADDAVTNAKMADNSVNSNNYVDGSVNTAHISNSAITAAKIANGVIAADKLAVNAVTTANITGASVTTAKLANNAVNGNILADNSVSTTKLQDDAVTKAKIENLINNNADNRVITGSGTENTLNGESNVVVDSSGRLGVGTTSPSTGLSVVNDSSYEGFNVKHSNLSAGIAIGYDTIRTVGTNANNSLNISTKGTGSNLNCQIGSYNVFGGMSDSRDFRIFKNANGWSTLTMDADGGITGPLRRHVRRMNNGQNSVATINVFRLRRYNWGSGFFEVRMYATYYNGSYLKRFRINGHGAGGNYYSVKTLDDNFTDGNSADWGVGCQIANASNSAPGDNTTYFCDVQVTIPNYWYGLCELVMSSGYQTNSANAGTSMGSNSYTLWN